jgi:hypothetical protein
MFLLGRWKVSVHIYRNGLVLINQITSESVELNNQFGHFLIQTFVAVRLLLSLFSRQVGSAGHARRSSHQNNQIGTFSPIAFLNCTPYNFWRWLPSGGKLDTLMLKAHHVCMVDVNLHTELLVDFKSVSSS